MNGMPQEGYFVMLEHPSGRLRPLLDEDELPCIFATEQEAETHAKQNPLGATYGYRVFNTEET